MHASNEEEHIGTEQQHLPDGYPANERFNQCLIQCVPNVILFLSPDHQILEFNPEAERLYGCKREDVLGKNYFEEFLPDDAREAVAADIEKVLTGKSTRDFENAVVTNDGQERILSWNVDRVLGSDDKPIGIVAVGQDITERKQAEGTLRESEEKYHLLVENAPSILWKTSEKGITVFISSNIEEVYDYTPEEIYTDGYESWLGRIHHDDLQEVEKSFQALFDKGEKFDVEYRIKRKDGEWIWVRDVASVVRQENGERYAYGVFTDITERKRAEEALRQSKEQYRTVVEDMPVLICRFLPDAEITYVNNAYCQYFEKTPDELVGSSFLSLIPGANRQSVMANILALTVESPTQSHEHPVIRPDGKICWQRWTNRALFDTQGKVVAYQSIGEDITEQKEAEKKIKEHQSQLKSLASELSLAEERERRRIAAGIHDDIAQKLAMAKFELQSLQASVKDTDVSVALEKQCQLMEQIVADARSLTFELGNPVLYQVGLEAAVESYLTEQIQEEFGIKCKFTSEGPQSSLEEDIKVVFFQSARELLVNVVKHANASTIEVNVSNTEDRLRIVVKDDGVGFDPAKIGPHTIEQGGFGLFNIRERLEYFGGSFEVESRPKSGTRVTMTVAVRADAVTE